MFPAPGAAAAVLETATAGVLCPAADRAPRLGAAGAHVGAAVVVALKSALEVAFLVPALLVRGESVAVLFEERRELTHVAALDSTGNTFLDLDAIFLHLDHSAMHTWHSLERVAVALAGSPGADVAGPALVGTARAGTSRIRCCLGSLRAESFASAARSARLALERRGFESGRRRSIASVGGRRARGTRAIGATARGEPDPVPRLPARRRATDRRRLAR